MYYHYNETMDDIIEVSEVFKNPCIHDFRSIPLNKIKMLDGEIYDTREIDYWKIKKTKELEKWLENDEKRIIQVGDIYFTADSKRIAKLQLKWTRLMLNGSKSNIPQVTDLDGEKHTVTREEFDQVCRVLGDASEDRDIKEKLITKQIKNALTIDEVKAIVIE